MSELRGAGAVGGLAPERRGEVARFGLKALLAGSLVNFANAAIAGIVATCIG
jgi:concentrative nucleoside transporter, CNT family